MQKTPANMGCLEHLFRKRKRDRPNTSFMVLKQNMTSPTEDHSATMEENTGIEPVLQQPASSRWRRVFGGKTKEDTVSSGDQTYRAKSTLGILSDKETDEVPGE